MFSVSGSARVEARIAHSSRATGTISREARGGSSADSLVTPDIDPAHGPVIPGDVIAVIPDVDA